MEVINLPNNENDATKDFSLASIGAYFRDSFIARLMSCFSVWRSSSRRAHSKLSSIQLLWEPRNTTERPQCANRLSQYRHTYYPRDHSGQNYGRRYCPSLLVLDVHACRVFCHNFRNYSVCDEMSLRSRVRIPSHSSWAKFIAEIHRN